VKFDNCSAIITDYVMMVMLSLFDRFIPDYSVSEDDLPEESDFHK